MLRIDEDIKKDLVDALVWDYRVDAADVKMEVSDNEVLLTGSVPSYTARTTATIVAWSIEGVRSVTNLLRVNFPPEDTMPSDDEIKYSAERSLVWNPDVDSVDIDVSVSDGKVRLNGKVDAYWKRWNAEKTISDLRGVTSVENHLAVAPREDYQDMNIARDIEAALERSQYVDAERVTIKVEDGLATLTGTVPTYLASLRANTAAAYTPGVIEVENRIVVI